MHDYNAELIRSTHANYLRWMHISPQAVDVRACDQAGIIEVCPAGDKEGDPALDHRLKPDVAARQWEQRMEVMRDSMVYFRSAPSILFWEAGNSVITRPYRHLRDRLFVIVAGNLRGARTRMSDSLRQHRDLLRVLETGTRDQFVHACAEHVSFAGNLVTSS